MKEAQSILIDIVRADILGPEPILWLWKGWLARGKFHLLAGSPGTGKTTLSIALAATITSGGPFPDGSHVTVGSVLIWSGEDDLADSILPRFMANGGDRTRLHFVIGKKDETGKSLPFDPATDFPALAEAARTISDLRLLIIDPVVSAVSGDSHKNAEVRRALQPIADFAAKADVAVLGISHYTKGTSGRDPVERVTGSLAFAALARLVLAVSKPVGEGGWGRLVRAKSNIGPDGGGFEYALRQVRLNGEREIYGQAIVWGQVLEGSARELLAEIETPDADIEAPARDDAARWLASLLEAGPRSAQEICRLASLAGHKWRTVRRAKVRIGVRSQKSAMSGGWLWMHPKMAMNDVHTTRWPPSENPL